MFEKSHIPARPIDGVILEEKMKNGFISDLDDFLKPERRFSYKKKGIPCRRGYLFHGPPGNGKTSLVNAVAGKYRLPIYYLPINDPTLTDEDLLSLVQALPDRCILLLKDIDAKAFLGKTFRSAEDGEVVREGISLAGFLQTIDNIISNKGIIIIGTTNFPENL